ncbi:16S rRNA (cytidine(1402)-2'-O)-methyltransferase [Streptococcus massiliensis]|uniref:Ribosomal RNA small subunit methyltransferase I n=1 Tax=Streptococcus massiliensis TaxID=313439 RepID=A0A380KYV1_9STRE|nr:16S rRNA (cytidine(1402)-2'-O)-methyltransferase [Streptococcus massiliensis]SUN76898.1 methyltransferase [Streptococcus massiliensis]
MKIQKSFKASHETGTLYLVGTPIGNLADMTYRAVDILSKVDVIAAEDTRNTGLLLKHYQIDTPQLSFHEHNAQERIPQLLQRLEEGQDVAQVSDAGLPSISDPGYDLVRAAIAAAIPVVPIPGPSAGITALIASGLAPQPHIFYGFLPRKASQQKAFFKEHLAYPETQIFYESPYRVAETLKNMQEVYGDRQLVLVRELTKIYEEFQRGKISEILSYLAETPAKGECLLIVEGAGEEPSSELNEEDLLLLVAERINAGAKTNQAVKEVAKLHGIPKSELYALYHQRENEKHG